ncbi:hypothetical protein, partial [Armatimonas sp.]|uniref:hypothetical protein n=1 Tax=Armatimonas sp. TaxID=1872638 RepID=UPI00286A469A
KFGEAVGGTSFDFPDGKGKQIVKKMSEATTAAGISQVPTLWIRDRSGTTRLEVRGATYIQTTLDKLTSGR